MITVLLTPQEAKKIVEVVDKVLVERFAEFSEMSSDPNVSFAEITEQTNETHRIHSAIEHVKNKLKEQK